jgi:hypothetical protein
MLILRLFNYFMKREISLRDPVIFANNPFNWSGNPYNYTHWEENYVSNTNDTVLYNYDAIDQNGKIAPTIATYELHFGNGKVMTLGLSADTATMFQNKNFLKFLGTLVLQAIHGN